VVKVARAIVVALLSLLVIADAALISEVWLTREPAPPPLDGKRVFAAARPAIVLVQSNYKITTSVPDITIPRAKLDQVTQLLVKQVLAGKLNANDNRAVETAAMNIILGNPDAYFEPAGNRITDTFSLVSSGSGFFINEDGFLVTAAHVVKADPAEIRRTIVDLEKRPAQVSADRAAIKRDLQRDTGITPGDDQLDSFVKWFLGFIEKSFTVDKVDARYYLGTGTVETGDRLTTTGTRASLLTAEPVPPGRDVAVMKADVTPGSVPALTLAASEPHPDSAAFAVGYPRRGFLEEEVQLNSTISATLAEGNVVAKSTMPDGWSSYKTTSDITHGNSGGPVLDAGGAVMGIVSFGELDASGNLLTGGYFVPIDVIKTTLAKVSVKPAAGTLTPTYLRALRQGEEHRYRKELALLSTVRARSRFHAYIQDDVSSAQARALAGQDQTPPELAPYLPAAMVAAGGSIPLAFAVWMGLAFVRRRPLPAPQSANLVPAPSSAP
jgi:S1-C subfamily serine protease